MGRGDRRKSLKMRRRVGQAKKKAAARRKVEIALKAKPPTKASKKKSS